MSISTEISKRFWNQPQKADEEAMREQTFIDDIIQKAHIEKEVLNNLSGIHTVFDGGAGSGRFSILLAARGIHVTHFDISLPMIEKAKELAKAKGVIDNMSFIHGSLEDLREFHDKQFDMVISFDAPISYTYPNHESVIKNLVRIASKRLIISVYNRAGGGILYHFNPAYKMQYILDQSSNDPIVRWILDQRECVPSFLPNMKEVRRVFEDGLMDKPEDTMAAFEHGSTPWPISYSFMPEELLALLHNNCANNVKLSGPGALSRSIPNEVLVNIMHDARVKQEFLDFCYVYDSQPWCAGMGTNNIVASVDV